MPKPTKLPSIIHIYLLSWLATIIILAGIGLSKGAGALVTVLILAALEITFSFDNAVINARILSRMSAIWQQLFLTVGIAIAVIGLRILFPLVIVALTAQTTLAEAWRLAFHRPDDYARLLDMAHPAIAAFGGMFLILVFLDFMFEERDVHWIGHLEHPLQRAGQLWQIATLSGAAILLLACVVAPPEQKITVAISGSLGLLAQVGLDRLGAGIGPRQVAKNGLVAFLYLEILDASFSLDGVLGAFAITNQVLLIAAGLGIGAVYVRSLTIYLVRHGSLNKYRYIEHGAHWAIGLLAASLLVGLIWRVPGYFVGLGGLMLVGASLLSSHRANKSQSSSKKPLDKY